jgi:uracil phosphoribosyltransferase
MARAFPNLTVLDHPLIAHKLTLLRDRRTGSRDFKELVHEIAMLMGFEATKDLPTEPVEIETPLERMQGVQVAGKKVTLVPILRAGLGMVDGIAQVIPSARVGHIGLYRDHDTLEPVDYYFKIPAGDEDHRTFFVLDPMLATGGSATAAVSALKKAGARRLRFLCIVAAPEGVRAMLTHHPDVPVFTAALDRELNAKGYILPGLGDAGDRLFGTA